MKVNIEETPISDVFVVQNGIFLDERGFFQEVFNEHEFKKIGLPNKFVQLNHSRSAKNILRGLHFQWEPQMGKLMRVTLGEAFLVAVDIRVGSTTFGKWFGKIISEDDQLQIWAPAGCARGFCVLSDFAEIQYLCTGTYNATCESGIAWDDPNIGIDWPINNPILSEKDQNAYSLSEWKNSENSKYFTI